MEAASSCPSTAGRSCQLLTRQQSSPGCHRRRAGAPPPPSRHPRRVRPSAAACRRRCAAGTRRERRSPACARIKEALLGQTWPVSSERCAWQARSLRDHGPNQSPAKLPPTCTGGPWPSRIPGRARASPRAAAAAAAAERRSPAKPWCCKRAVAHRDRLAAMQRFVCRVLGGPAFTHLQNGVGFQVLGQQQGVGISPFSPSHGAQVIAAAKKGQQQVGGLVASAHL